MVSHTTAAERSACLFTKIVLEYVENQCFVNCAREIYYLKNIFCRAYVYSLTYDWLCEFGICESALEPGLFVKCSVLGNVDVYIKW